MLFHPYFRFPFNCLTPNPDVNRQQKMNHETKTIQHDRQRQSQQTNKGTQGNRSYGRNKLQTPDHEYIQVFYKKKDVFVYRKGQKEKYLSKKIIRALDKIDNIWKSFTKGGR